MLMMIAAALAAAPAPATPVADAHAQHMQMGQTSGMDMSKMDHSKMDHSKMDHSKMSDGCCKKGADGKMECSMPKEAGTASDHQGHSGH